MKKHSVHANRSSLIFLAMEGIIAAIVLMNFFSDYNIQRFFFFFFQKLTSDVFWHNLLLFIWIDFRSCNYKPFNGFMVRTVAVSERSWFTPAKALSHDLYNITYLDYIRQEVINFDYTMNIYSFTLSSLFAMSTSPSPIICEWQILGNGTKMTSLSTTHFPFLKSQSSINLKADNIKTIEFLPRASIFKLSW